MFGCADFRYLILDGDHRTITELRVRPLLPAVYGGIAHFLHQYARQHDLAKLNQVRGLLTGALRTGAVAASPAGFLKEELFVLLMRHLEGVQLKFGDKDCLPSSEAATAGGPIGVTFNAVIDVPDFKPASAEAERLQTAQRSKHCVLCIPQASNERWVDLVVYDFEKTEVIAFQVCPFVCAL